MSMFDPWNATLEDALKAQEAWNEKREGVSPLFQWNAAERVKAERAAVDDGDGFAVLACVQQCVTYSLIAPKWLAYASNRHYRKVLQHEVRSWDEAFGEPYPRKKLPNLRERRELRFAVWNRINEIRAGWIEQDTDTKRGDNCERLKGRGKRVPVPDSAKDGALFERVGEEFEIKKTLCSELYYEAKRLCPDPDEFRQPS